MKELKEIRFDGQMVVLKDNVVRGAILPRVAAELERDLRIDGETVVEGALYAHRLEVAQGPLTVQGAVFAQDEIHVANACEGLVRFSKSVGCAGTVSAHANRARLIFGADINAKKLSLRNAFVAANIFADEVALEDCVVLGGVFATRSLAAANCVLGTYNSPSVQLAGRILLLLPSAFSVEPVACVPGLEMKNLSLADVGALMCGRTEDERSGAIPIDPAKEETKIILSDGPGETQVVRSLSVAGKVVAADLVDFEKLRTHFLIAAGSLGAQLLKTYSVGQDKAGKPVELSAEGIADFLFDLLHGKIAVKEICGTFDIKDLKELAGR